MSRSAPDATHVLHDGPWRHRFVSANGARFHVAEAGTGPLVLLLHGFPQFWWCWRHLLPALAGAGYRAVAMDLRGYGASDKPPRGYDTPTLAADAAAVVRSLGEERAVVVGHDWGGWVAFSMPALQPSVTRAVVPVSVAHPLSLERAVWHSAAQRSASRYVLGFQLPTRPERLLTRDDALVTRILHAGGGPGWPADDPLGAGEVVRRYAEAMRVPFVAHSAAEYYRWVVRSRVRADGRRFRSAVRVGVDVPVLHLHGERDAAVRRETAGSSAQWVRGRYALHELPGVGHFLPEEAPGAVAALLLDWLAGLPD